ncbi:MAG: branched-chain amino acid ABC transporter permease [Fervidicoccaceae archaeon]
MEVPPILLMILVNFSAALMVTTSLNVEVGLLGIPQFGRLLTVVTGAVVAAAVPGRILAALLGMPWGSNYAYHLYNYGVVTAINSWLAERPLASVATLLFTLVLSAVIGALVGYACSYPALRLREAYLGITLLAFGDLLVTVAKNYVPLAGGTMGVIVIDPFRFVGAGQSRFLFATSVFLLFAVATLIYAELLVRSPLGRTLKAARDSEVAASVFGKDVVKLRKQVLMIGGALAAMAGALWALYTGSFMADTYTRLTWTFWPWAFMMLGGTGNNIGILLGVVLYTLTRTAIFLYKGAIASIVGINPEWLEYIMIGAMILAVVLFRPQGLLPERPTLTLSREKIEELAGLIATRGDGGGRSMIRRLSSYLSRLARLERSPQKTDE